MAGLALKLAPHEQVMINGVIVENGPRRAQLLIKTENASVLRMRDALSESDVIGPASRAYITAQRCVAGEITADEAAEYLMPLMGELKQECHFEAFSGVLEKASDFVDQRHLYRVMRALKPLLAVEREARVNA